MSILKLAIPIFRSNPDNTELVENAATLLMELANYRKLIYYHQIQKK